MQGKAFTDLFHKLQMVLKFTKMDNLLETLERSAACSVEFFIRILLSVCFSHTGLCISKNYKENSYNQGRVGFFVFW